MRWFSPGAPRGGGVRPPAVAGMFYSGQAERLASEVDRYLAEARAAMAGAPVLAAGSAGATGAAGSAEVPEGSAVEAPGSSGMGELTAAPGPLVAVVAPHAGHIYSGPTAGYAYAAIDPSRVRRVVLLGPAHYVPQDGIGLTSATAWRTPLGDIPIDGDLGSDLRVHFDSVVPGDAAHAPEHSLEVQLPFLQRVLDDGWQLVPLIVGRDIPEEIAAVIHRCAALPETLVVVSTDLSHYLDHDAAVARDARTIEAVVQRRAEDIGPYDACGRYPLRGLVLAARDSDWTVSLLDARNSGDTAGDWDRVVGYAAFAVTAPVSDAAGDEGNGRGSAASVSGGSRSTDAATGAATDGGADQPSDPATGDPDDPASGAAATAPAPARIDPDSRSRLLRLARQTIEEALDTGRRPEFDPSGWDPELLEPGAAFVTLRSASGDLLGCIGSLAARQPLVVDVADHAFDAAFRDPRFLPLTPERAEGMVIDISVLSPTRTFPCAGYADLLERVPPGSGVVVEAGRHRGTFLPAVWEQLPEPRAFLAALWRKAGLAPREWPAGTRIELYDSEEFAETGVVPE